MTLKLGGRKPTLFSFSRPARQRRQRVEQGLAARHRRFAFEEGGEAAVGPVVERHPGHVEALADGVLVQGGDVVEVEQVFDDELPVAVEDHLVLLGEAAIGLSQPAEVLVELGHEVGERGGAGIEIDEHPAGPAVEPQRVEAAGRRIEGVGPHIRRADEAAVEVVAPAVIGAAEPLGVAGAGGHLDAAVAAHVGVGAELAREVAGEEHRFLENPQSHVVSGRRELLLAGDA